MIFCALIGNYFSADTGTYGVTISAVPEPSTWAAVGLGFGALAYLRRRRVA